MYICLDLFGPGDCGRFWALVSRHTQTPPETVTDGERALLCGTHTIG